MVLQSRRVLRKQSPQNLNLVCRFFVVQSQQHDTFVRLTFSEDFFTKILVVGNNDPVLRNRFAKNHIIGGPARLIANRKDFVSHFGKPPCHGGTSAFID
jgi:hypothetical protein